MSTPLSPTPGPWSRIRSGGSLILIVAKTPEGTDTVAVVHSDREMDAIAISLVPDLLLAVRTGDVAPARHALNDAGLEP